MLSDQAVLELTELSSEAERLARGSASDRKRADVFLARCNNIRSTGISSDEARAKYTNALVQTLAPKKTDDVAYRAKFDKYLAGHVGDAEMRDFLAGTQTISWTSGQTGGYFVPFAYDDVVREAMAQVDPILSANVTSFDMTSGPFLQPEQISGYDLSTVDAELLGESVQQTAQQPSPAVLGGVLRNNLIFKVSFAASMEAEFDVPNFAAKITRAASVALARRIGTSVLTGRGGSDISGVVQALGAPSVTNGNGGKLTLTDINNIFFSVNRWYRAAPKCGWLMTDGAYKFLRNAVDSQNRPLLNVERDSETLLGKPVYISPSLANLYGSIGIQGALIFGDLASIVIRCSRPQVQRHTELSEADVTRGEALFIGRSRADSAYFDPSGGLFPPLVLAAIN